MPLSQPSACPAKNAIGDRDRNLGFSGTLPLDGEVLTDTKGGSLAKEVGSGSPGFPHRKLGLSCRDGCKPVTRTQASLDQRASSINEGLFYATVEPQPASTI